jgi:MoaA/NifB/PqqE/SkfB family radical SAM enzyme
LKKLTLLNKLGTLNTISTVGSILSPIIDNRFVPYPYFLTFVVTHRCNSRCQMCNLWKEKESPILSLDEIEDIFSHNDFSFVRSITLTGGEPTMRADLPDLFRIVLSHLLNVEHLFLAVNGLTPQRTVNHVTRMLETLRKFERDVRILEVQISLDGVGEVHDAIRGVPGAFERVKDTLNELQILQKKFSLLSLRLSCVVMPYNLPHIGALETFAESQHLPISYSPIVLAGDYYNNLQDAKNLMFSREERVMAMNFFKRLSQEEQTSARFYYEDMAQMLQGNSRLRRCMMGFYGCVIEHDAEVYPCVNCESQSFGNLLSDSFERIWFGERATQVRENLRVSCCPSCTSLCYPLPVNFYEVAMTSWRKWQKRFSSLY